jgi:hypothetical protein
MPPVRDFRNFAFQSSRVDRCGRSIASRLYWKLYAIENTIRIVIHSVLTVQIDSNWWNVAVDGRTTTRVLAFRRGYAAKPKNAQPGTHDIYLVFLTDLAEIIRANSHLFTPIIRSTDQWIGILESIRVPRNLVGHMNYPNSFDKNAIDHAYSQLPSLVGELTAHPVPILIPK